MQVFEVAGMTVQQLQQRLPPRILVRIGGIPKRDVLIPDALVELHCCLQNRDSLTRVRACVCGLRELVKGRRERMNKMLTGIPSRPI